MKDKENLLIQKLNELSDEEFAIFLIALEVMGEEKEVK